MDFEIPPETDELLSQLDTFLDERIDPLAEEHPELFNHRREAERTDWESGTPTQAWTEILDEMSKRADEAGLYRLQLPKKYGGRNTDNVTLALVRERLNHRGPPTDSPSGAARSIIGNFDFSQIILEYGSERQRQEYGVPMVERDLHGAFGLTEPAHGSDVTYMESKAEFVEGGGDAEDRWVLNGEKRWISDMHRADVVIVYARTSGEPGDRNGITAFLVPTDADGVDVPIFRWTMMMPTDAGEITLDDVTVPESAVLGDIDRGLQTAQHFLHEGRIRQAAESLGAAQYALDQTVEYANDRMTWGKPLSTRQGVQFPVANLQTEAEMIRSLLYRTASILDKGEDADEKVSMVNYRANRLACDALDMAIQLHGGLGYSRHRPFEHLYRYFRRYRITEGADEIHLRNVAGHCFGFL